MYARLIAAAALGCAGATGASAADFSYAPPPKGDVFYQAPSVVQAHVDVYGGFSSVSGLGSDDTSWVFGGAGRINVPLHSDFNAQVDVQGNANVIDNYSASEFGGYLHLYKRDPNSHAIGAFVGADYPSGGSIYMFGVEGQMYWPQFTLYGQAIIGSVNAGPSTGTAYQLRGEGQYYLTDNTALVGDVIWTGINGDSQSGNVLSLVASAMHRFDDTPLAGFIKGRWDHLTGDSGSADVATLLVGVRLFADPPGSTLKSSSRNGPPMNVEPLILGVTQR